MTTQEQIIADAAWDEAVTINRDWREHAATLTDPFSGCGVPGCVPGRPCPACAARLAQRHTSPATLVWCAERGHPWSTYNASLDRSYCRCGTRQENGEREIDMDAIWDLFHDHPRAAPCACYTRAQQAI